MKSLGIPQAERKSLAGVGAQYDSELVYHNVRAEVAAQGVVYTDMESALTGAICGYGAEAFYEAGNSAGSQICRTSWSGLVRRLICLCTAWGVGRDSVAVLFSD